MRRFNELQQKSYMARQNLIEDLIRLINSKQCKFPNESWYFDLAIVIALYLKEQKTGLKEKVGLWQILAQDLLEKGILPKVRDFSSSPAETNFILFQLWKELVSLCGSSFLAELKKQEYPEKI